MARNALIVGPPRTGTSLAAKIFSDAGYHVGSIEDTRYREGDDHNPFGYFEADAVIERNVDVLRRVGFEHHNTWTFEPIGEAAAREIWRLEPAEEDRAFVRRYDDRAPWVWKDPRLCFTLPYWGRLLDPDRTAVLLVTRDTTDVYHSFRRKEWCGAGEEARRATVELVERHLAAARRAVEALDLPHTEVDYGDYERDLDGVTRRIGRTFDLDLSPRDVDYRPELDHSDLRGRLSGWLRKQLKRLPRGPVERLASLVPRRLLGLLFPERRHTDHPPSSRTGKTAD